jgi:hypothetical protein
MNKALKDMLIEVYLGYANIGRTRLEKAFISFEQSKSKINYLSHLQTLTKEGLEELKPTFKLHKHESMFYFINENALIKLDLSEVKSDLEIDNLDFFDINIGEF